MSKQLAILEYTFMFDPTDTWQNGSRFERDLCDFFAAHSYEANVIEARGSNRRVVYIERVEEMPKLDNKKDSEPQVRTDPLKFRKTVIDNSFKKVSEKPLLSGISPYSRPQKAIHYSKDDWKKGHSVVRKIYLKGGAKH